MFEYLLLAFTSLLAATLLPLSSEAVIIGMQLESYSLFWLWISATAGNTLGAVINWWLGRYCLHFQDRRWFPANKTDMNKAQRWFQRYGRWSLLFSWLPLIGDGLTFVAGIMRVPIWQLAILAAMGKGGRYAVLMWLVAQGQIIAQ
ncbi:YqaA family protein [Aurantivibrio plasticivorans]